MEKIERFIIAVEGIASALNKIATALCELRGLAKLADSVGYSHAESRSVLFIKIRVKQE